jgi:hypothetical protein
MPAHRHREACEEPESTQVRFLTTSSASRSFCVNQRARLYAASSWGSTACSKLKVIVLRHGSLRCGAADYGNLQGPLSRDQQAEAMDGQFFRTGLQVPF